VREIRTLRLTWQGMETWLLLWRHPLTLPVRGPSGNRRSYLDCAEGFSSTCLEKVLDTAKLK
jgi:hypothetical protein